MCNCDCMETGKPLKRFCPFFVSLLLLSTGKQNAEINIRSGTGKVKKGGISKMAYKTQMEAAKQGIITKEMEIVAKKEYMEPEKLRELVASGQVAIPCNVRHTSISPEGIGGGLRTKINVNLGISGDCRDYTQEFEKVKIALKYGAEAIMDLSNYGKTNTFRQQLIDMSPAMIGTVPMYDAIGYLEKDLAGNFRQRFSESRGSPCQGRRGFYDHSCWHQSSLCGGL